MEKFGGGEGQNLFYFLWGRSTGDSQNFETSN